MAQTDFQARLARLGTEHEAIAVAREEQGRLARVDQGPEWVENAKYPLSFVVAFLVGMSSVLISRYVSVEMMGVPSPDADPDIQMILDGVMAGVIIWMVRMATRSSDNQLLLAQTVGLWVMITMMHNLVHIYPVTFGNLYSPEWVDMMLITTEPGSIRVGSYLIPID